MLARDQPREQAEQRPVHGRVADRYERGEVGAHRDRTRHDQASGRQDPFAPTSGRDRRGAAGDRREQHAGEGDQSHVGVQQDGRDQRHPHHRPVRQRHVPRHVIDGIGIAALQQPFDRQLNHDEHVGAVGVVRMDQDLAQPHQCGAADQNRGGQRGHDRRGPAEGGVCHASGRREPLPEHGERDVERRQDDGGEQIGERRAEHRLQPRRQRQEQHVDRQQQAPRENEHAADLYRRAALGPQAWQCEAPPPVLEQRYGSTGLPFHHRLSASSSNTAKCRCGVFGGALPVVPT